VGLYLLNDRINSGGKKMAGPRNATADDAIIVIGSAVIVFVCYMVAKMMA
jgi:hypothetical protein